MARWHLTLALSATAVAALLVAPQLRGISPNGPVDAPPTLPPPPSVPEVQTGVLRVDAGLDRTAVLGHGEERFLAITVTAPTEGGHAIDRPVDLAVVIDASGSMSDRGKIDYARKAAKLLASNLDEDDRFSLVTFNDAAHTLIPARPVTDPEALHRVIDGIFERGGTNLYGGLEQGGDQVRDSIRPGMVGRVVVLSDGHANVGLTAPSAFQQLAGELAGTGVTVSAIGLGRDYNEDLLAQMADIGGGSYDYVEDPRELTAVLSDELERTASVVARGVSVKIELPPEVEPLDVLGWDATRTDGGWTVWMGDVFAGETRKIIARVRVRSTAEGEHLMANVQADYHDLLLDGRARSTARAMARVTRDSRLAEASVDRDRAAAAQKAWGAWYMEQSTAAWAAGDKDRASRAAREGQAVLRKAAYDFADDELEAAAEQLEALGYVVETQAPTSYDGKGAMKAAKEEYRALAR